MALPKTISHRVESLRYTRRIVAKAAHTFLHIERNETGEIVVEKDDSGCLLLDVYVQQTDLEDLRSLPAITVEAAHALPILDEGFDSNLCASVAKAKSSCLGLFDLPEFARKHSLQSVDNDQQLFDENSAKNLV